MLSLTLQTIRPEERDLLLPKLSPPRLTTKLIAREHLLELIGQTLSHDLTLLSASAGFGKTTLLSAWVERCPAPVAWLSLEEQDNDPSRFWGYVFAALRTIDPQSGEIALNMLQSPHPPALTTILTALINRLMRSEQQYVLALDDFHVISHPDILDSFQFLLAHLPTCLHLVLAGRVDPQLGLSRLRAHGQVLEIRKPDLRFTRNEAASFLTQSMGLSLTEEEIELLEQRAEGWIAGLQLAALAIRARKHPSAFVRQLRGNQRYILEYMQEEVLERQPAAWQDFLLHTSILKRLNASLCQAVTEEKNEQDSQQILEELEQANLFLVPLDEGCKWYRFHSLFRDVLQARLQAVSPELIPRLHQRAARWYAEHGNTFEAVEHALTGTDFLFAGELMERAAKQMWNNGEAERLSAWLQRLPDALLLTHGRLMLTTTLQLLYQAFYASDEQWISAVRETEQIIARMTHLLADQTTTAMPEAEKQVLHRRFELLQGWIAIHAAYLQGWEEELQQLGTQMQELARDEDMIWKMIPTFALDIIQPEDWSQQLSRLKQQANQEGNFYEAAWIAGMLSILYQQAGQLHRVYRIDTKALQHLEQIGKARARFGYSHLNLAFVYGEWNQLEEARSHLQIALDFARTWQHTDLQLRGYEYALQFFLIEDKLEQAEQTLAELALLARQNQWGRHRSIFATSQVHIWLAQGKLTQAADWAAHVNIDLSKSIFNEREALTLIRVYLALQRHVEALHLLEELLTWTERNQQIFSHIYLLALQVAALYTSGDMLRARQQAAHLLTLTEPEGYVNAYLEAGQPMREVLQSLHDEPQNMLDSSIPVPYVTSLLTAFAQQLASQTSGQEEQSQSASVSSLLEPLTPRELEVLQLMARGATNQAIANQLTVSLATAKKHVTNLLGKLGAENRVQAVARARELSLL